MGYSDVFSTRFPELSLIGKVNFFEILLYLIHMIDLSFPSFMTKLDYNFSIYWWLKTYMLWAISRYIYYVCPANSHQTCVQCYNSSNLGQTWFLLCISMIYAILNYLFLIFGSILFTLWQFLNSLINSKIGPFWLPICQLRGFASAAWYDRSMLTTEEYIRINMLLVLAWHNNVFD